MPLCPRGHWRRYTTCRQCRLAAQARTVALVRRARGEAVPLPARLPPTFPGAGQLREFLAHQNRGRAQRGQSPLTLAELVERILAARARRRRAVSRGYVRLEG